MCICVLNVCIKARINLETFKNYFYICVKICNVRLEKQGKTREFKRYYKEKDGRKL